MTVHTPGTLLHMEGRSQTGRADTHACLEHYRSRHEYCRVLKTTDGSRVRPVKRFVSRFVAILWLMAALSLVGWLIVNLDTAGWILVILTTSLMTFEPTRRPVRRGGPAVPPKSHPLPDEPTG